MISPRKSLLALAVLGLFVALALVAQERKSPATANPNTLLSPGHVVVLTRAVPAVPSEATMQLAALDPRTVSTMAELIDTLRPDDLLVIDSTAFSDVASDFLQAQLRAGRPLIGLNIPAAELAMKSGFLTQSAQVQQAWGKDTFPPKPASPFFSVVLLIHAGNGWQRLVAQPLFSDGLFRSYLNQAGLAAQGLTSVPSADGGKVIPLADLDTPVAPN
ncbi:MAG TPA: hypothetical protein VFY79_14815 [Dehalococcoidia bacterium]|nr:hypothetical protein [Dehalococcoidia bacterium]